MKIAIDNGPLTGGHSVRGVGVSTGGLIDSLVRFNHDKNIIIEPVNFLSADLSGYDVLHYTSFNPYFLNYPRLGSVKGKVVLTIHDLIPIIYKKHHPSGIKGQLRFGMNKFLLRNVDAIITVSETSKKDIVRLLGINEKKVEVIYWACDEIFRNIDKHNDLTELRNVYKLPQRFVLYVGDVNYNKNLETLIKACKIIGIYLVIVGKQAANINALTESWKNINGPKDVLRTLLGKTHPETAHFKRLADMISKNKVVTTGYVPKKDLPGIYSMASVYCQPSYYEGFGIPILEAFSCGIPVVISKTQALVEIADGAALEADTDSPNDFADKIISLFKDSTEKLHLIRAGRTRAKEFLWEETANKTLEVYKKVYGR